MKNPNIQGFSSYNFSTTKWSMKTIETQIKILQIQPKKTNLTHKTMLALLPISKIQTK